jgi:hypothetical protein
VIHKSDVDEFKIDPKTFEEFGGFLFIRKTVVKSSMNESLTNIYLQGLADFPGVEIDTDFSNSNHKVVTLKNRTAEVDLSLTRYGKNMIDSFKNIGEDSRCGKTFYKRKEHHLRLFYREKEPYCNALLLLKYESKEHSGSYKLKLFSNFSSKFINNMNWNFNFLQATVLKRSKVTRFKLSEKSNLNSKFLVFVSNKVQPLKASAHKRRICFLIFDCEIEDYKEFIFDYSTGLQTDQKDSQLLEVRYVDNLILLQLREKLTVYNVLTNKVRHFLNGGIFASIDQFIGFVNLPELGSLKDGKNSDTFDVDFCNSALFYGKGIKIIDFEAQRSHSFREYLYSYYKEINPGLS